MPSEPTLYFCRGFGDAPETLKIIIKQASINFQASSESFDGTSPAVVFPAMSTKPSKSDELENRMIRFAVDIVKLVANLPNTAEAKHIGTQLLRSGTAAAPNYAEARAAESRADFIHKLKIALKELNETSTWLRIIQGSIAVNADFLSRLVAENGMVPNPCCLNSDSQKK